MKLTTEEQLVRDLAVEHSKKKGSVLDVQHIISHSIAGSEQVQTYMVIGEAKEHCRDCGGSHNQTEVLMFLRIGHGFSLLEDKRRTCLHESKNDIASLFKILLDLTSDDDAK